MRYSVTVSLLTLAIAMPAVAQEPSSQAPTTPAPQPATGQMTESDVDAIVVTAERVRGQVQTSAAPVVELDEKQVASYGATSIADLVAQLAPQVGSGRGRGGQPVFLVNGQRISSFREMGRYPPEAIRKVEVLPEQVAVKFGYPPDQRVINFILKDNFASKDIEVEYGQPTRGGYSTQEGSASILTINGASRTNASVQVRNSTPLTEAERGVIQTASSVPVVATDADPAAFRSLVARSSSFEANATRTTGLGEGGTGGQFTLNGNYVHATTRSLSGLDTVVLTAPGGAQTLRVLDADPLARRTNTDSLSLGSGLNKTLGGGWRFSTTLDANLGLSETLIDRRRDTSALTAAAAAGTLPPGGALPTVASAGFDEAKSTTYNVDSLTTFIGALADLPAGELGATFSGGLKFNGIRSNDTRSGGVETVLDRRRVRGGVDFTVPIASRRDDVLAGLGDLQFSIGGDLENLSDFGTLTSWNLGTNWKPLENLTLQASYRVQEVAPTLSQLGNPAITQFNVPTFDFTTGQTVLITTVTGGNPNLLAETQRDLKLSANYDIDVLDRANILVEYYRNRSDNVTSGFPLLTPAIETAFPGRVTRNGAGQLVSLDARPVTFAQTRSERVRYGFNLFGKLGKPLPAGQQGSGMRGGPGMMVVTATGPGEGGSGNSGQAGTGQGAPGQGAGRAGGMMSATMDPQRFAALREKFCATPEGTGPDLTGIPEQMLDRLKGEDGQIDPAKVAVMRARFCSADAARRFDPARFAAMRQALCADPAKQPDPAAIPEEIRDRLKGPDGTIAPERLKEFQTRICALPTGQGGAPGAGGEGRQRGGGEGGGQRGGGEGGGGGGGMRMGPGGDGQGRWNLSLYHTVNLANSVLIAPGGPFLDLLDGDATGNGGGVSRHQLELEGGAFYRGLGMRLSGTYASPTTVRGTGLPGSSDLRFGSLATFNLRTFIALDQQKWLVGENPGFLKQARVSLRVNNIFDTRQRITDENGVVPIRYQPFLVDPVGRFVEIEFRKLF